MRPQSTPGRLRRVLSSALFQLLTNSTLTFGKRPRFHHFPKGVLAHRRLNAAA
ncbi:hypothetical protein KFU94_69755 [Chloroflexi bacterium TSY]|nr:hypothetical protein [Chloroflexi bacterium TSY]